MSRIGIKPVTVPEGVSVELSDRLITARGNLGERQLTVPPTISVSQKDQQLTVSRQSDDSTDKALHGTIRSLLANLVQGVSAGFTKKLELVGLGYRAALEGETLVLQVGFTHSVKMTIPAELKVSIEKNVITVQGADKQAVGQFAAEIRAVKPPEPYKGKGIRYVGEQVRMKQGKAAKAGA